MTLLKAFVSHSFLEVDDPVVKKFVNLLDQVAGNNPAFSWDRAIRAEPRPISEKVQDVFEGKNVFIAICSEREQTCVPADLKKWFFRDSINPNALTWKTSDWILQEIGLARGRGCKIILLLENGIRNPAPLLADTQHIRFNRRNPEGSFVELLAMIASLSPRREQAIIGEAPTITSPPPSPKKEDETGGKYMKPEAGWKLQDYLKALLQSVAQDDAPKGAEQEIDKAFQNSPFAESGDEVGKWEVTKAWFHLLFNKSKSLQPLLDCVAKYPSNADGHRFLAQAYERYDQFADAAKSFQRAAEREISLADRIGYLCSAAVAHHRASETLSADDALNRALSIASGKPEVEVALLLGLKKFADATKDKISLIGLLERLLELDPSDPELRFSLAYEYGEQGNTELSLYHYLIIRTGQREGGAWNNLAVARHELELPSKAVEAYKIAVEKKNTLAMANLARAYLNAGFSSEAELLCQQAMQIPDSDPTVLEVLGRAKASSKEEEEAEQKVVEKVRPYSELTKQFGRASALPPPSPFPQKWRGKECELSVSVNGSDFLAIGKYEESPPSGLINALSFGSNLGPPMSTPFHPTPYHVEYRGKIRGRAVVAKKIVTNVDKNASLLGAIPRESSVLLYLSDDNKKVVVVELLMEKRRATYEWSAIGTVFD